MGIEPFDSVVTTANHLTNEATNNADKFVQVFCKVPNTNAYKRIDFFKEVMLIWEKIGLMKRL